jgi:L-fucose isomerase-like protein
MSPETAPAGTQDSADVVARLRGRKIARIGAHPDGFDTCAYDAPTLQRLSGVTVDALELDTLFDRARCVAPERAAEVRSAADATLEGLDTVNQEELDRSLRLKVALDDLKTEGGYDAFALRCWPETFTEYGGAVCGPVSMMGEARVPCACEADVYGALTQMVLQEAADAPVFLVDLVDMDMQDNSGVVWHCGQAPISMRDPESVAEATIHTNRKMPLLYEFPLKPGRVTLMRISQAHGAPRMVLAGGEMLQREMAFTGTSGVIRFDRDAADVLPDIIDSGLEHHMALVYGEHRDALRAIAGSLGLPLLEL